MGDIFFRGGGAVGGGVTEWVEVQKWGGGERKSCNNYAVLYLFLMESWRRQHISVYFSNQKLKLKTTETKKE
jgi:hypothetical protein